MMKLVYILFCLALIGCSNAQDCQQGINQLPMYGGVIKCKEQIYADNDFFSECDKQFKSRKEASGYYSSRGWDYYYKNDLETCMKRFNQAWLLDSLNPQTYWGFANVCGIKKKYKESLPLFEKALQLDTSNPAIWESAARSYMFVFSETEKTEPLKTAIEYLKRSLLLDSTNNLVLGNLTTAYAYFNQKDSARKYLRLVDERDPSVVTEEIRKFIK